MLKVSYVNSFSVNFIVWFFLFLFYQYCKIIHLFLKRENVLIHYFYLFLTDDPCRVFKQKLSQSYVT